MRPAPSLGSVLLASVLAAPPLPLAAQSPEADGWRPFTATWSLSGERQTLPTEGNRPAAIIHLQGQMVITGGEGLGRGFLVETIGFDDGGTLIVGRIVLIDTHGDRIFSTLKAEPIGTGRKAAATVTGGTGRFAGIEGTFSLAWQYIVDAGDGEISGRAVDLEGRTRLRTPAGSQEPR